MNFLKISTFVFVISAQFLPEPAYNENCPYVYILILTAVCFGTSGTSRLTVFFTVLGSKNKNGFRYYTDPSLRRRSLQTFTGVHSLGTGDLFVLKKYRFLVTAGTCKKYQLGFWYQSVNRCFSQF